MGLDSVELVMEVEEAFDIKIPDDRVSQMLTVGDLYDYIIVEQLGVKPAQVRRDALFVQDLGVS